jgi:cytochrome c
MSEKQTAGHASSPAERESVTVTSSKILRQLSVIVVVVTLWSALLVGYLALTGPAEEPTPAPQPTADEAILTVEAATEVAPTAKSEPADEGAQASFSTDVLPIFEANCQRCHGTARADAGLSLSDYGGVMAGSRDGAVVTPGSAEDSILVQVLVTGRMPRGAARLSDADIQTLSEWVNAGAPDN